MTKHMRLIVSVLFIVVIILAIAITRFNSSNEKGSLNGTMQPSVAKKLGTDSSGNRVFQDTKGLYGILDSNDRLIVSPEWRVISFTDGELCIASKRLRGKDLFGCIDYEGNIKVPFVFSSINRIKANDQIIYSAKTSDDRKFVIYDSNFNPCFSRSWDDCSLSKNNELILTDGSYVYKYSITAGGLVFTDAQLNGQVMNCSYDLEITSRVLLSKLSISAIEKMNLALSSYMEYAFTGNSTLLSEIDATPSALFLTLFPEEHSIISKRLTDLSDIFVYSKRSEDGLLHYAVSATANISLTYKDQEDKTKRLRGKHKAVIEFEGISANELKVISARFEDDKPVYPSNEPTTQSTDGTFPADQPNIAANQLLNHMTGIHD